MKNNTVFIILLCLLSTLWSCINIFEIFDEDFDEETEEFNPEKGKYYLFENEYPSDYEWDWQIFKDDTLMSVKDDTLRKQILCRIGLAYDEKDCIIFKVDYDGNLINFGNLDTIYSAATCEDKMVFWYTNNNSQIITNEILYNENLNSSNSRGYIDKSLKAINGLFTAKGVYDGGVTLKNHRFKKFGKDAVITGISMALPLPLSVAFSGGVEVVNHKIEKNNENTRNLLYGDCVSLNINSVNEISEGILSVNITVKNIHTIPRNIHLEKFACTPQVNKNLITLGVLARCEYIPYTDEYDFCSFEIPINLYGDDKQTFNITLPRLKGGLQIIRPYIRSEIDEILTPILKNIDGELVVYGEPWSHHILDVYIIGTHPKEFYYDYSQKKNICSYDVEILTNATNSATLRTLEYGIYERGNTITHYPIQSNGSKLISINEEPEHIELNYKNYTSTITKKLGAYVTKITASKEAQPITTYYDLEDYELTFQLEKPSIEIKSVKLIDEKTVYSTYGQQEVYAPAMGVRTHFMVHVVSKTMPFGYMDWAVGGEFFSARGGTSSNPTLSYLSYQDITAVINKESDDNINYHYDVYVTKFHSNNNIGENPIYFGYKCKFTETDSIVSKNYIKFDYVPNPLLDVDGAYRSAEIITGKMPKYVHTIKYAKE